MDNLQKFKRVEQKVEFSLSANFKNLFLSPIIHGILAFILFLSTSLVVKLLFVKSISILHLSFNPNELVLGVLAGGIFFSISLKNKIRDFSIR